MSSAAAAAAAAAAATTTMPPAAPAASTATPPAAPAAPTALPPAARLTALPEDVLAHIARHLGSGPSDLLPFAEASPLFHAPALSALNDHLRLTSKSAPDKWAKIANAHLRALTLVTPVPSDPPLFAAYSLLRAPRLTTLSTRADNFTLSLVAKAAQLSDVALQLRRADVFPQMLHTLAKLPRLRVLSLAFAPDYSVLRVPHARRCACAPLRDDPDALARAAPRVRDFSLACGCAAAAGCDVPAFAELDTLSLSGDLPTDPPTHLIALAQKQLRSLRLAAPAAPAALARALGDAVTHVHATAPTASLSRLTAQQLTALVGACPQLTSLRAGLHADGSRALPVLGKLTDLRIWQPVSRASSLAGMAGCPVPRGTLPRLAGLRVLHLHGAAAHAHDIAELVRAGGAPAAAVADDGDDDEKMEDGARSGGLRSLTVSLEGQPGALDMWLRTLLAAVRRAPALTSLTLPALPREAATAAARDMVGPFTAHRRKDLRAAVERVRRRRPRIELVGVDDAVAQLVNASKALDRARAPRAPSVTAALPGHSVLAAAAAAAGMEGPPVLPIEDLWPPPPPPPQPQQQPQQPQQQQGAVPFEMLGVHEDVLDDGDNWADDDVF